MKEDARVGEVPFVTTRTLRSLDLDYSTLPAPSFNTIDRRQQLRFKVDSSLVVLSLGGREPEKVFEKVDGSGWWTCVLAQLEPGSFLASSRKLLLAPEVGVRCRRTAPGTRAARLRYTSRRDRGNEGLGTH